MTGAAHLFPGRANGSLVRPTARSSAPSSRRRSSPAAPLPHPPSATSPPYNAAATTFANLGPTTLALNKVVAADNADVLTLERPYNPGLRHRGLPVDAVTTSGSGIDPRHLAGVRRAPVAARRGVSALPLVAVQRLIEKNTDGRSLASSAGPG